MQFSIIAAIDAKRGLGKAGKLAWDLRADMQHFKAVTVAASGAKQNAVIMGRTTWESLPERFRPLPQRLNVVLSRNQAMALPEGVLLANSLDEALQTLEHKEVGEVFVIGGASVYAEAVKHPQCKTVYLTEIEHTYDCDTFFPELPTKEWQQVAKSEPAEEGGIHFRFVTYQRQV